MSVQKRTTVAEKTFLQPPPGQIYVRSFLFSRRIDAPFGRPHLLARALLIFALTSMMLRAIDTTHPDPVATILLLFICLLVFLSSGLRAGAARLYLLLTLSPLLSLFTTWVLFNPVPGRITLLQFPLYSGQITFELTFWELGWLLIAGVYFFLTRKVFLGLCLATIIALLMAHFLPLPAWEITHIHFFHPLQVFVSDRGVLVASTKIVGYAGMVFATIALVVTSRDVELIGTLRQLHVPQPVIFFLSTVFRSLDLALSDYTTIRQAQRARAIDARPRSLWQHLSDLASLCVPIIATMLRRSSEMGDALVVRGYTLTSSSSDFYETSPLRTSDWLIIAVSIVLLLLAFLPHGTLTSLVGWTI